MQLSFVPEKYLGLKKKKTIPLQAIKALGLEEGRALLYEAIFEIEGTVASSALLGFSPELNPGTQITG